MTSSPQPLPSLPPSPNTEHAPLPAPIPLATRKHEEDIAQAWHEDEPTITDVDHLNPHARKKSRKGKERAGRESDEDEEDEESAAAAGYPPTKEEEAESRRVEETLRRWEIAERQRRKAARESASALPTSTSGGLGSNAPSLLADLFRRDSRKAPLGGVGTHQQLSTTDKDQDGVPLDDLDTPSVDRFSPSPSPGPPTPEPENPFETPNPSRTSLNIPAHSAIMTESDTVPEDLSGSGASPTKTKKNLDVPQRPTLQASSSFASAPGQTPGKKRRSQPPPPQPLGLPAPREPPPPDGSKPPEPIAPPSVESRNANPDEEAARATERAKEEDAPPVRWWHEWLCGCGEGPDRGGDHQAGRTNPFE